MSQSRSSECLSVSQGGCDGAPGVVGGEDSWFPAELVSRQGEPGDLRPVSSDEEVSLTTVVTLVDATGTVLEPVVRRGAGEVIRGVLESLVDSDEARVTVRKVLIVVVVRLGARVPIAGVGASLV